MPPNSPGRIVEAVRATRGGYAQGWYARLQGREQTSVGAAGPVFVVGDSLTVGAKPAIEAGFGDRSVSSSRCASDRAGVMSDGLTGELAGIVHCNCTWRGGKVRVGALGGDRGG